MGWFIAQSLAFIIIAALIGLATGIWIGWLAWGRRGKGKHAAEKAAAAARLAAAESGADAKPATRTKAGADAGAVPTVAVAAGAGAPVTADGPDGTDGTDGSGEKETTAVGTDTVLPVADSASDPGSTDDGSTNAAADPDDSDDSDDSADSDDEGDDEVRAARSAVVAEAEAVARKAAEADTAAKAATARAETEAETATEAGSDTQPDAGADAGPAVEAPTAETPDDLRRIEGIGPKIASALVAAGYPTYARIAAATEDELREAVAGQGIKFAPSAASWADQAKYLVDSDTDGLAEYQDYLVGGQERRAKFNENVDYADVDEIAGAEAKAEALAEDEAEAAVAPEPEPEPQDLRRIEGIGPKIEATLQAAGYATYARIAAASETELREALATGGITFAPAAASWAEQAQLLADGDEAALQEYQDYLIGGQDRAAKFKENVDYTDVDEIAGAGAKAQALAEDEAKAAAEGDAEAAGPGVKA